MNRMHHVNYRELETLTPLSRKTGIDIEMVDQDAHEFAKHHYFDLLQSGKLCGKAVVISWEHGHIPELATAVGCGPDNGCPSLYPKDSFNQVWQLKYVFDPPALKFSEIEDDDDITINKDDVDATVNTSTRRLKHEHRSHGQHRAAGWTVYASVGYQNFDPLNFSYKVGDYPYEGTASGGRWHEKEEL